MILERFDNDSNKYYEWSLKIRDEMVRPIIYIFLLKVTWSNPNHVSEILITSPSLAWVN